MRLGDLTLHLLPDGDFFQDGGAMFGVVPKVMWEKRMPPNESNQIRNTTNCLLVESGSDLVLIDTGLGGKLSDRMRSIYAMDEQAVRMPDNLAAAGFDREDVTQVLLTHLHFDHCGWNTVVGKSGLEPTFPNARYWINRTEIEHARDPNDRDRISYIPDNWEPLFEAGQVELFDEAEPCVGIRAFKAGGHSPGMCIVLLDGGNEERGAFFADLVPTAAHVPYPWIMSYDLEPMKTLAAKKEWLPRASEGNWLCFFEHDSGVPAGRLIEERPGRFRVEPEKV
jgi:glyoxylase-like metal-dependent hydrolase (beta-lactamase superfamily II)